MAAFGLAVAVLGGLTLFETQMAPQARTNFFGLARLSSAIDQSQTIVIIGSSKTRCAVEGDKVFAGRLRRVGLDYRVVRITRDRATAVDLDEVFDAVVAAAPKMVLIEADMIVYEPNIYIHDQSTRRVWQARIRQVLRDGAGFNSTAASTENWPLSPERSCAYSQGPAAESDVAMRWRMLSVRSASSAAEKAPYVALVRDLRAHGTPTYLLHYGRRPDRIGAIPKALAQAGDQSRVAFLRRSGAHDLGPPIFVPASEFYDAGHMTPQGKNRTSAWLAERLSVLLATSGA